MKQYAPDPIELFDLVEHVRYRPGWTCRLFDGVRDPASSHGVEAGGLSLEIRATVVDTHDRPNEITIRHISAVPAATFNRESWTNWLFERFLDVERHEAAEYFAVVSEPEPVNLCGAQEVPVGTVTMKFPYQPVHAPGWDPYMRTLPESSSLARGTRYDGSVAS